MTSPWPNPPQLPGNPRTGEQPAFPATQTLPGPDRADVSEGECLTLDSYGVTGELLDAIRQPLVLPAPITDPALRGAA
ncbi:hypothetical protein GA0070622_0926 [Micromonospora sediminicola]|uniref:Uncharacterized protein n=1 Tax=Micromonospora sediminicola TaxID=946078 RepID=A0A1A9B4B5_9ACTN|nr:hypothetical protein GA0070622_0926 [Micromonospora sediminicola]